MQLNFQSFSNCTQIVKKSSVIASDGTSYYQYHQDSRANFPPHPRVASVLGCRRLQLTHFSRICSLLTVGPGKGAPAFGDLRIGRRACGTNTYDAHEPRPTAALAARPCQFNTGPQRPLRSQRGRSRPPVKLPENILQKLERHQLICPCHQWKT